MKPDFRTGLTHTQRVAVDRDRTSGQAGASTAWHKRDIVAIGPLHQQHDVLRAAGGDHNLGGAGQTLQRSRVACVAAERPAYHRVLAEQVSELVRDRADHWPSI